MFTYQTSKGGPMQRMGRTLTNLAFAWANRWTVWVQGPDGRVHTGLIVRIGMESGYHLDGGKPEHFLVSIADDHRVNEVYVKLEAA